MGLPAQDCNFNVYLYFKTVLSAGHLAHMNYLRGANPPACQSASTCLSACVMSLHATIWLQSETLKSHTVGLARCRRRPGAHVVWAPPVCYQTPQLHLTFHLKINVFMPRFFIFASLQRWPLLSKLRQNRLHLKKNKKTPSLCIMKFNPFVYPHWMGQTTEEWE